MKIIVCIKRVVTSSNTDHANGFRIGASDMFALKLALSLKHKYAFEVDIICMAPLAFVENLKQLYVYDINSINLASDNLFANADTFVTSFVLYSLINKIGMADIILCGKSSDDSGTAQIGPSLAERLQAKLISNITTIEINGEQAKIDSRVGNARHVIQTRLPIIGTVNNLPENNVYPSLRNYMRSSKEVIILNAHDLAISQYQTQPLTKVIKMFSFATTDTGEFLEGSISNVVDKLVNIVNLYN